MSKYITIRIVTSVKRPYSCSRFIKAQLNHFLKAPFISLSSTGLLKQESAINTLYKLSLVQVLLVLCLQSLTTHPSEAFAGMVEWTKELARSAMMAMFAMVMDAMCSARKKMFFIAKVQCIH